MSKLVWDAVGERLYETGTSNGILFVQDAKGAYPTGVAWNGLISAKQSPDGAEPNDIYADNMKYLSLTSAENFKGSIEAYTYPEEFAQCDGSATAAPGVYLGQQPRKPFALVYSTIVGNDTEYEAHGEKLHIIYNAKASPSERSYETVGDTPNALTFSWDFTTLPVPVEGYKPTSYIAIDSTKVKPETFKKIKDMLHGTEEAASKLPTPDEIIALLKTSK